MHRDGLHIRDIAVRASLLALALAALAPQAFAQSQAPKPAAELACPEGSALAVGRPAGEIFSHHYGDPTVATWCERYDADGNSQRHGPYLDVYPGGAERARVHYDAGRPHGPFVARHENGQAWLIAAYRRGVLVGPYTIWDEQGLKRFEGAFAENGSPDGDFRWWHDEATLAAEARFTNGVENGVARSWHADGALRTRVRVRGAPHGPWERWHRTGGQAASGQFATCAAPACKRSERTGTWRFWQPDGRLIARGQFAADARHGDWRRWNARGVLRSIERFERGDLVDLRIARGPQDAERVPASPQP